MMQNNEDTPKASVLHGVLPCEGKFYPFNGKAGSTVPLDKFISIHHPDFKPSKFQLDFMNVMLKAKPGTVVFNRTTRSGTTKMNKVMDDYCKKVLLDESEKVAERLIMGDFPTVAETKPNRSTLEKLLAAKKQMDENFAADLFKPLMLDPPMIMTATEVQDRRRNFNDLWYGANGFNSKGFKPLILIDESSDLPKDFWTQFDTWYFKYPNLYQARWYLCLCAAIISWFIIMSGVWVIPLAILLKVLFNG